MIKPMYFIDVSTGATLHVAGYEYPASTPGTEPPYEPCRWVMLRQYRLPATGPGGHPSLHWAGAALMLLCVFALLGSHL